MGRDRQGLPQSDCQGSQLRLLISVIALCCSILAMADQGAIFLQGKDLGNSKNEATFSGIGSGAVSDKVPAYGSTPTEAQLFQGGKGNSLDMALERFKAVQPIHPASTSVLIRNVRR